MSQPTQASPSAWEKSKTLSKKGFDKAWGALDKLGTPVNHLSNKLGSEAFWPMTLDKESEKAARILRGFCKDGVYTDVPTEEIAAAAAEEEQKGKEAKNGKPRGKQHVVQKIPTEAIRRARGIAIFTAMRSGLWFSGAGGSGVLLAKNAQTGEWSSPSGILLHTAGLGFLAGIDIYDCVVVINTDEALEAFSKLRCTLGGELTVAVGPVGAGGVVDSEVHKRRAPIWTYVKSRGFYAGVQVDGTIVIERTDENERFYGRRVPVAEILAGQARSSSPSVLMLQETLRAAEGVRGGEGASNANASAYASPDAFPPTPEWR